MRLLSKAVNELTGKPEAYIMVSIQGGAPMLFATSEEPCCFCELFSIGAIGGEKNSKIAARIMAIITDKLGVDKSRTYMSFTDAARSDFAWNGATF
jgi:phenylpyruvate tautomerase